MISYLDLELDVLSHIFDADPLTCNVTSELDLDSDIHQVAELGNVTIIKGPGSSNSGEIKCLIFLAMTFC